MERDIDGRALSAPEEEGPTHPLPDDYYIITTNYIKSICPSGGHGRGHRPAIQNRAAARYVQLTVNLLMRAHVCSVHMYTDLAGH